MGKITKLKKRDDRIVDFDLAKVESAIYKAMEAAGDPQSKKAAKLAVEVEKALNKKFHERTIPAVEEVQDLVEEILIKNNQIKTAKGYILYREQHAQIRNLKSLIDSDSLMEGYLVQSDWRVKENSNMAYSLQGLNNHVSSAVSAHYWLHKVYPQEVRDAHANADIHIHDLQTLAAYCCGWDLREILIKGFGGVESKVTARPAKHFRTALGHIVNFFYTLQGETAGAQAFSSFDTYLAPFVAYDNLNYDEVKQCIQEFLFNMNVPTRVGFQCMSEDTEILTAQGWKGYKGVKVKDIIATFNINSGIIEYLPVKRVFARAYKGKMYNLKNRISDQLISPEHRVVRRQFSGGYTLEPIEKVLKLKSPFIVPVGSLGNISGQSDLTDSWIKFLAWVIAEGSMDKGERGSGRISIYQSSQANRLDYEEIVALARELHLTYAERTQSGLGLDCQVLRFDAASTRKILSFFGGNKNNGIKFIPAAILSADAETSRLFLETYIKGDGHDECKITTSSEEIKDGLMMLAVNAGYGATVSVRRPDNALSKKDRYIIRLIRHSDTYINEVKQIDYQGVIWCPNTDNETVIARRNGKIFITGNTPFTNITLDLVVPGMMKDEPVIIGGKFQDKTYKEFDKEIEMINLAFTEVMTAGDANGRVFTFPIPTYNITKDFDWDKPVVEKIMEMTAKYGIPYFSNFVNSDMKPEDARSMCCRLRLDNRELRKRGGGLFAANPLTGSIGVVTINLARIGYLAEDKNDFLAKVEKMMTISRQSLELKRKVVEQFTEDGLYPYSRYYLQDIKSRYGEYWKNHFNTIGINGMNEAAINLLGQDITTEAGHEFAKEALDFMREKLMDYQIESNNLYNLEATPAEGTSYRFAKADKLKYPDIICADEKAYRERGAEPYYTNSSQLPVDFTDDIFAALDLQDDLQTRYTGGTVFHGFIGERMPSVESTKQLVKKIAEKYHLPYFTVTPTFSVCPVHGYISGEHFFCPKCDAEIGYVDGAGQALAA